MKIADLKNLIRLSNIREDSYSLNGGLPNEAYCLNRNKNTWEVYYSERGNKTGIKEFSSEEEACEYLWGLLSRYAI